MNESLKKLTAKYEAILKQGGLEVINTPQQFAPSTRSVKSQTHIREALLECLAQAGMNELSPVDLLIAQKYAQGTSYRQIANELRTDNIIDLHFSNVQRRLQRILAYFASKAIVKR